MAEKIRVLFIDDDFDFVKAAGVVFDSMGLEVIPASTEAEGFQKLQTEQADVIVLDLVLENVDEGFSIVRKIRNRFNSDVPVVMLSSLAEITGRSLKPEEHPDYFPVNRFLEKPVSPGTLIRQIRDVLGKGDV
ncbi:MAG: response regulator [Candidatus Fermentibacteraceae bacterium]|nr:response regulator [Candidatus Fermentibacteraceae bacterium]